MSLRNAGVARCGGCGHWCYIDTACDACGTDAKVCVLCDRHPAGGPHGLCVACVRAAQLAGVETVGDLVAPVEGVAL